MSPHHLSRVFRARTGHTVARYRLLLRARTGLERIAGGERDLARLAVELGFADQSHLCRVIRRRRGTPRPPCGQRWPHDRQPAHRRARRGPRGRLLPRGVRRAGAGRIPTPDGRIMSLQLHIGETTLHVADEFPEMDVLAPPSIGGSPVVLGLEVDDAEAVFARAVAAGAQVRQPLGEMFWGDLHGQLEDPFGHRWNISQHLRDVPSAEVVAAAAQLFK